MIYITVLMLLLLYVIFRTPGYEETFNYQAQLYPYQPPHDCSIDCRCKCPNPGSFDRNRWLFWKSGA